MVPRSLEICWKSVARRLDLPLPTAPTTMVSVPGSHFKLMSCIQLTALIRGIVLRHYYEIIAKSAGRDARGGAVAPFE